MGSDDYRRLAKGCKSGVGCIQAVQGLLQLGHVDRISGVGGVQLGLDHSSGCYLCCGGGIEANLGVCLILCQGGKGGVYLVGELGHVRFQSIESAGDIAKDAGLVPLFGGPFKTKPPFPATPLTHHGPFADAKSSEADPTQKGQ